MAKVIKEKTKPAKSDNLVLSYKVVKIQTTNFRFYDHNIIDVDSIKRSQLHLNIGIRIDGESLSVILDVNSVIKIDDDKTIIEHTGRTVFLVKELKKLRNKTNKEVYDIPNELLVVMYSIAYSHERALLAVETSPTIYKDKFFLPIVDPNTLLPKVKK